MQCFEIETERSTWSVEETTDWPIGPDDLESRDDLSDEAEPIEGLPARKKRLTWWFAFESPCFVGDDMWFAVDTTLKIAYMTFDGYCSAFEWNGTLREFVEKICMLDDDIDKSGLVRIGR